MGQKARRLRLRELTDSAIKAASEAKQCRGHSRTYCRKAAFRGIGQGGERLPSHMAPALNWHCSCLKCALGGGSREPYRRRTRDYRQNRKVAVWSNYSQARTLVRFVRVGA